MDDPKWKPADKPEPVPFWTIWKAMAIGALVGAFHAWLIS